jgi:hypothetical protein
MAAEFARHSVRLHNGQIVELDLAERGTRLPNNLWVREVRPLNSSQTQTLILSTDMRLDLTRIAAEIAARWSQENFIQYIREHYGLDRLIEYGTQPLPETLVVVNPAWRRLDQSVRRERARLYRLQVEFGARTLPAQPSRYRSAHRMARTGSLFCGCSAGRRLGWCQQRLIPCRDSSLRPREFLTKEAVGGFSSPPKEAEEIRLLVTTKFAPRSH